MRAKKPGKHLFSDDKGRIVVEAKCWPSFPPRRRQGGVKEKYVVTTIDSATGK
jgi:hypothetical protein